jgi:uncharacterized membrane-anchored protein
VENDSIGVKGLLSKVPEISLYFWIIKVLTTAMGESLSDFLVAHIDPIIAVSFGGVGLAVALVIQFKAKKFIPWVYWLAAAMVAVFGTMAADAIHIVLGVPYLYSTLFFAVVLGIIFGLWYWFEKTLSIHSIHTFRRELFYWATVMATFALGTATGDMTASTLGLGYFASGVLFAVLIAAVAAGHYVARTFSSASKKNDPVLAFWIAYILTRPLGASFADWAGKSHSIGGLGYGDGTVSICLIILIACFVAYVSLKKSPYSCRSTNYNTDHK